MSNSIYGRGIVYNLPGLMVVLKVVALAEKRAVKRADRKVDRKVG